MSDRYMVTWICGSAINGIYTMAYKIPGIFNVVVSIFNQAFSLSAFKECDLNGQTADGKVDGSFFESIYSKYLTLVTMAASFVIIITQPIAYLIIKKDFYSSWHYTTFLLIAFVIGGIEAYYAGILTGVKKTTVCLISTIVGAGVNIIVNATLIPLLNAYGAVIGTIVGYIIVYIIRLFGVKKYVSMDTKDGITFLSLIILILQALLYSSKNIEIRALCFICFFALIIIHKNNIKELLLILLKRRK